MVIASFVQEIALLRFRLFRFGCSAGGMVRQPGGKPGHSAWQFKFLGPKGKTKARLYIVILQAFHTIAVADCRLFNLETEGTKSILQVIMYPEPPDFVLNCL